MAPYLANFIRSVVAVLLSGVTAFLLEKRTPKGVRQQDRHELDRLSDQSEMAGTPGSESEITEEIKTSFVSRWSKIRYVPTSIDSTWRPEKVYQAGSRDDGITVEITPEGGPRVHKNDT